MPPNVEGVEVDGAAPPATARRKVLYVPKAPEIVAQRIQKQILAGVLKVGESLPSEGRLMEELGVSRPTVREAFRILEAQRLISVARGARGGAIIHAPDPELISAYTLLVLQAERTTVDEVFSTRRLLEPRVAREVALKASNTAPAVLRERLAEERATSHDVTAFTSAVAAFHRTLVDMSGNRPLIHLMRTIASVVETHQAMVMARVRRGRDPDEISAEMEVAFKSQNKLIELIEQGGGDAAEEHWRKHMERSHKRWIAGYEELTIHSLIEG